LICGLLGERLSHSYSPAIHGCLGDYDYMLFEVAPPSVGDFLKNGDFHGLNVTIPYKKSVIPYLAYLSPEAERIGSVNTIIKEDDGLYGYNTDYLGFLYAAEKAGISFWNKKVLILGSGGASLAVKKAVEDSVAKDVLVVSRTGILNYSNVYDYSDAEVIINATPVGMYPECGGPLVDLKRFPKCRAVMDLIYNPLKTRLILDAEALGIKCAGGLWMLVCQAKYSSDLFLGTERDNSVCDSIYADLLNAVRNVVLVGMPGSGKTTVGKLLAQKLDCPFVDTDSEIEKIAGMSIPDIFAKQGEKGFREIESSVIKGVGRRTGTVIATGGGAVLSAENRAALRQNGLVVFVKRSLDALDRKGRPLSDDDLGVMYQERLPFYEKVKDIEVDNSFTPEQCVDIILDRMGLA